MKMKLVAVSVLATMMTAPFAQTESMELKTDMDKVSYSIGYDLGINIAKKGIDINVRALALGIKRGMGEGPQLLTDEQMKTTLMAFQKQMMAKASVAYEKSAKENQVKGKAFLEENKKKPGVVMTASGLQYKVIKEGKGAKPTVNDVVTVDYTGTTIDGTVFDSTEQAGGHPATFILSQVISGWIEALQLMSPGATYELVIPSNLAYGPKSAGEIIGPNSTLIFKVHLISIEQKKKGS